jgi:3-methyladenine DNA glycosylase AlkD
LEESEHLRREKIIWHSKKKRGKKQFMNAQQILAELKPLGSESYKRILCNNHGVREPCFGVKISELKKIRKRVGKDHQLALDLWETGNYDAMYLAGMLVDDKRMTKGDLQRWAEKADGGALAGTVAAVAAGGAHGWEMGLKWIESSKPNVAVAGWQTLGGWAATREDGDLELASLKELLRRVQERINAAADGVPDIVRSAMNIFVISVGCYVKPLTDAAIKTAEKIGRVHADLGNNSCEIPYAPDYIRKVEARGTLGKKRKTMKC